MVKYRISRGRRSPAAKKLLTVGVLVGLAGVFFISQYDTGSLSSSLVQTGIVNGACTVDSQCEGGFMCMQGTCQSAFACRPFVNATWSKPNDLLAGGAFDEARNTEYMQLVPISGMGLRRQYALRVLGDTAGTHSAERGVLKYFGGIKESWAGSMLVNLSKVIDPEISTKVVVIAGGYTDRTWPSGVGSWKRDFVLGGVTPPAEFTYKAFGAEAYDHNAFPPYANPGLKPKGEPERWPDRFIPVDWYFTPSHHFYVRVDGQQWVEIQVNPWAPEANHKFLGFAAGWISSYSGGSIDIKQVKLYDSSCLDMQ